MVPRMAALKLPRRMPSFAEYLFGELEFEREINGTEELSVECEVNGMVFLLDFKKEGEELYIYHDVQYPVGTSL